MAAGYKFTSGDNGTESQYYESDGTTPKANAYDVIRGVTRLGVDTDGKIEIWIGNTLALPAFLPSKVLAIDGVNPNASGTLTAKAMIQALSPVFPKASTSGGSGGGVPTELEYPTTTSWDGSNKYITLTQDTSITLDTTRTGGYMYVRQDGVGGWDFTINDQAIAVGASANQDSLVTFSAIDGYHVFSVDTAVVAVVIPVPDTIAPTITSKLVADSTHINNIMSEAVSGTVAGHSFRINGGSWFAAVGVTGTTTRVFDLGSNTIAPGDTVEQKYDANTGDTVDVSPNSNQLATFSAASVTNGLTSTVILSNAAGIASGVSGQLGNAPSIEVLNLKAVSKVTTAGTVNSVKFNLNLVPTGITGFYFKVERLNGGTYDQVGSTITIPSASFGTLTTGVNTWANGSPFAVQVGDVVVCGYTGTSTNNFMGGFAGSSGDSYYLMPPPSGTTGIDWSSGVALSAWLAIQLVQ